MTQRSQQGRTSNCSRASLFTWGERSTVYTFLLQQGRGRGGPASPSAQRQAHG